MSFINRKLAKFLKAISFVIIILDIPFFVLGLPILMLGDNPLVNTLKLILVVILLLIIGVLCGMVGELALNKLEENSKNN